jgi:hypothetical protein
VDDPLSDAVLHRQLPPGTALVLSLDSDGAVCVRTEEEEAEAQAEVATAGRGRGGPGSQLAVHPSGVDGGILVSVAPQGMGAERSSAPQRESVMLTATLEEH